MNSTKGFIPIGALVAMLTSGATAQAEESHAEQDIIVGIDGGHNWHGATATDEEPVEFTFTLQTGSGKEEDKDQEAAHSHEGDGHAAEGENEDAHDEGNRNSEEEITSEIPKGDVETAPESGEHADKSTEAHSNDHGGVDGEGEHDGEAQMGNEIPPKRTCNYDHTGADIEDDHH